MASFGPQVRGFGLVCASPHDFRDSGDYRGNSRALLSLDISQLGYDRLSPAQARAIVVRDVTRLERHSVQHPW
jgi:hypothetical protein